MLSRKPQEDIDSIYNVGIRKFGKEQALDYLIELRANFELLPRNPGIGKHRNEIKEGLYRFPQASHIIFYRLFQNHIRIMGILHGSRDLRKFL